MTDADQETVPVDDLRRVAQALLEHGGAREADARMVADELVLADRSGVASHGVVRVGEYLAAVEAGRINTAAQPTVAAGTGAATVLDGDRGFGQVVGALALETATARADREGVGLVIVRNSHHIGRIGSLCEAGAAAGYLVLALVAVGIPGPVAPLGGREGRLGTNPIAFGVPTEGEPIVADFATAAMPEGVVQLTKQRGGTLPPGVLVDADGRSSTDPNALYTDPPGAILPFGGPWAHRGFALNLMVELFAGTLAGYGPHADDRTSNCMLLLVVDPRSAHPGIDFASLAAQTAAFVASAAPADGATVMLPGQPEARSRAARVDTVPVAASTLDRLDALAAVAGVLPVERSGT